MSRTTIIVLIAAGATVAGFVLASNAERSRGDSRRTTPSVAAGPQSASLGWRERYGSPGEEMVFTVHSLEVTEDGWRARIGIENHTKVAWEVSPGAVRDGSFGLQLFDTGDEGELDSRNRSGTLPAVRPAGRYEPALPEILDPATSWEGEISARGALVASSWVRVVFGTLIAVGKPPDRFGDTLVWITDHSYRLRE